MNTILITGSEGSIGTYLVEYLQKVRPDFKIIRVKLKEKENEPLRKNDIYIGNLADNYFAKKIFQENKIDYVICAAARSYDASGFNKDIYGLLSNDAKCLLNVLDNSQSVKKFVYFSSAVIYDLSDRVPFVEESVEEIQPPKSSLGLAKYFGEKAVKFFSQQYGVVYTIWRPFNVVSPIESHERGSGHVFVDLYRKIFVERTPKIEIYGNGQQVRCFTWVEDVIGPVADFLTDEKTDNQIFNIGSNQPKTIIELKEILIKIGKEKNILPIDYNPEIITGGKFFAIDTQLRIPSTEKIKKVLGWECQTDFKDCFEKFIEYKQKRQKSI